MATIETETCYTLNVLRFTDLVVLRTALQHALETHHFTPGSELGTSCENLLDLINKIIGSIAQHTLETH